MRSILLAAVATVLLFGVTGRADETGFTSRKPVLAGVVLVSFNYRLNLLSGFAHPLLSKESGHGSGNYGLLD
jgi:para-nitrobenzyl esterase